MSYKLGIIGGGYLTGTLVLPALQDVDEFDVVCMFDKDPKRLEHLAERFDIGKATASQEEFFDQSLDAVYIATPNTTHAALAGEALSRGLAVLVEKPLADTLAAAGEILQAVQKAQRPAMVGYMSKRNVYNQMALKLVQQGRIGRLMSMTARHGFVGDVEQRKGWRFTRAASGFGALSDLGIYPVTTAYELFAQEPVCVSAYAYPAGDSHWSPQYISATVTFPQGRRLQFRCSFYEQGRGYSLVGESGVIQVKGIWSYGDGEMALFTLEGTEVFDLETVNPFGEEFRCFARSLAGEPVPRDMSIERAYMDMKVLDALDRSAAQGGKKIQLQ